MSLIFIEYFNTNTLLITMFVHAILDTFATIKQVNSIYGTHLNAFFRFTPDLLFESGIVNSFLHASIVKHGWKRIYKKHKIPIS